VPQLVLAHSPAQYASPQKPAPSSNIASVSCPETTARFLLCPQRLACCSQSANYFSACATKTHPFLSHAHLYICWPERASYESC
jgi:hypothetical protein